MPAQRCTLRAAMHDSADEFEWDEDNEEHIAEHDVDPYEAEDAVLDPGAL